MAVLFSQKQHDDFFGGALLIAIYCILVTYACNNIVVIIASCKDFT